MRKRRKKDKIILIVFFILTSFSYGQGDNNVINDDEITNLNDKELFNKLFDNPNIDNGIAVWQPNYYESMNFNLSYDGKCHTSVDTLLYFRDNKNRECSVVIFKTMTYKPNELNDNKIEVYGCHFCEATISAVLLYKKENLKWEVYKFEKNLLNAGLFGGVGKEGIGKISIEKNENECFLSYKKPIEGNSGEINGKEILFSIDEFTKLECEPLTKIFNHYYYLEKNNRIFKSEILFKKSSIKKITIKTNQNIKNSVRYYSYSDLFEMYK